MKPRPERLAVTKYGHHVPALDGVRGFAILWVMLHNCATVLVPPLSPVLHIAALLTHPGWIGVQLFFALSGFLITGGLLDTQGSEHYFRSFYTRRALRILPLYYAILILIFVALPALYGTPRILEPATRNQIWLWTFLSNWNSLYGFQHYWSLAIEEQFYLFWPLLVYRTSARRLFDVCIAIALIAMLARSTLALNGTFVGSIYTSTICRFDALALGGAAAAAIRAPELMAWIGKHINGLVWSAAILFVVCIPLTHAYATSDLACQTFGYTILAVASAVLIVRLATTPEDPGADLLTTVFGNAALRSLGRYSYAIYLFHVILHQLVGQPVLDRMYGQSLPPGVVGIYAVTLMTTSYLLAYCSYHGFEKHWLKLKNRFAPAADPSKGAAVA
jgi:peptidoglycan/LPS O-acetylase OafA/YrhL